MITSLRTRLGSSSLFAVAIVAVAVLLLPATAGAQQVARRFGIGVGIGDVHNIFATSAVVTTEDAVAAPAILFPIQITDWLRIEPEIAAFRHRHEEPINYTVSGVELGLGIFPQLFARTCGSITALGSACYEARNGKPTRRRRAWAT